MAVTTVQDNNKLVIYEREIAKEFVRGDMFKPYMGDGLDAIIRRKYEFKQAGEQMNIPLVARLKGVGKGAGTLVGNEEAIDDYGMRLWIDWARNAVTMKKNERQKESADVFGEAKPLLQNWMMELQRDELIAALMALPSESAPTNLGSDDGDRVNGLRYEDATAAQRNTWNQNNSDRVLYGALRTNYNATHATALGNCDTTDDRLTAANLKLLKTVAKEADPKIRPYRTSDGYEHFVVFAGTRTFNDLAFSLQTINKDARPREGSAMSKNPLFNDGDLLYEGMIIREVPEISSFVTNKWTTLLTAGASSARVEPVFFCGQQTAVFGIGQMPRATFRKEDDYGFISGTGIEAAYGIGKMFKKHPKSGTTLKQWGMATGFFATI